MSEVKSLVLVISHIHVKNLKAPPKAWQKWQDALDLISKTATLSRLTLEIQFENYDDEYNASKSKPQLQRLYRWKIAEYKTIIELVSKLEGLKNFFVHINAETFDNKISPNTKTDEKALERMVMSASYDSLAHGKVHRERNDI